MPKLSSKELSFYKRVGRRIREARLSVNGYRITQTELARGVGVTSNTVSRWERGEYRPTMFDVQDIAIFFGVSPNTLFDQDVVDNIIDALQDLQQKDLSDVLNYIQTKRNVSIHGNMRGSRDAKHLSSK